MTSRVFLVKAVTPRKRIDYLKWQLAILKALNDEGEIIKRMYKKTVATWSQPKPVFRITAKFSDREGASVDVYTTNQKYLWVDLGTEPYIIRPRKMPYLKFRVGGKPKTKVRTIGSGAGRAGNTWVTTKLVRHPGIKAREFSDEIRKRRRPHFFINMEIAMARAQRKYAW